MKTTTSVRCRRRGLVVLADHETAPANTVVLESWGAGDYARVELTDAGIDRLITALTAIRARRGW